MFLATASIGIASGKNGKFNINNIPFGNCEVIFSYFGYETETRSFFAYKPDAFNYNSTLKPKTINLTQINVSGTILDDLKLSSDKDLTTYELNYNGVLKTQRFLDSPSFLIFNFQYASIDKYVNLLTHYSKVEIYGQWANRGIADTLPLG